MSRWARVEARLDPISGAPRRSRPAIVLAHRLKPLAIVAAVLVRVAELTLPHEPGEHALGLLQVRLALPAERALLALLLRRRGAECAALVQAVVDAPRVVIARRPHEGRDAVEEALRDLEVVVERRQARRAGSGHPAGLERKERLARRGVGSTGALHRGIREIAHTACAALNRYDRRLDVGGARPVRLWAERRGLTGARRRIAARALLRAVDAHDALLATLVRKRSELARVVGVAAAGAGERRAFRLVWNAHLRLTRRVLRTTVLTLQAALATVVDLRSDRADVARAATRRAGGGVADGRDGHALLHVAVAGLLRQRAVLARHPADSALRGNETAKAEVALATARRAALRVARRRRDHTRSAAARALGRARLVGLRAVLALLPEASALERVDAGNALVADAASGTVLWAALLLIGARPAGPGVILDARSAWEGAVLTLLSEVAACVGVEPRHAHVPEAATRAVLRAAKLLRDARAAEAGSLLLALLHERRAILALLTELTARGLVDARDTLVARVARAAAHAVLRAALLELARSAAGLRRARLALDDAVLTLLPERAALLRVRALDALVAEAAAGAVGLVARRLLACAAHSLRDAGFLLRGAVLALLTEVSARRLILSEEALVTEAATLAVLRPAARADTLLTTAREPLLRAMLARAAELTAFVRIAAAEAKVVVAAAAAVLRRALHVRVCARVAGRVAELKTVRLAVDAALANRAARDRARARLAASVDVAAAARTRSRSARDTSLGVGLGVGRARPVYSSVESAVHTAAVVDGRIVIDVRASAGADEEETSDDDERPTDE